MQSYQDFYWPFSTGYVSAALHLRHANGADRFHFSLCVNPHQVRCAAYLLHPSSISLEPSGTDAQHFYFWQMPEYHAAIQLNLARSRQEVKRQINKQHLVTFQNKTLCVDTSTQISKKLFCWSFGQEHFVLLFLTAQTITAVTSDYVIIAGTPWPCDASCLPYCAVVDSNCNLWGLPDGEPKPDTSRNTADPYPAVFFLKQ